MARKRNPRPHPRACNLENSIYMHENMRCPNGHTSVYLKGGHRNGVAYLEADCRECDARQIVTAEEVARPR
jgi:hypothetical protein